MSKAPHIATVKDVETEVRGILRLPSSCVERFARYEAYESSWWRRLENLSGRSLIIRMPREDGPKASSKVEKETEAGGDSD